MRILTLLRLAVCSCVFGAVVVHSRAQDPAERMEAHQQNWPDAVAIVLEVVDPEAQRGQVKLLAIDRRGAFAERHLKPLAKDIGADMSTVSAWTELIPVDYVFNDGQVLTQSQSPGAAYFEAETAGQFAEGFGPIQWSACPWPIVSTLMDRLRAAGATRVARGEDRHEYSASIDDRSGRQRMSLVFSNDGSLVEMRVDRGNDGSSMRTIWEFLMLQEADGVALPTRIRRTYEIDTPTRQIRGFDEYRVLALSTRPDDVAKALSRDIVVRNHNRFDRTTANLYAPDGTLIHNEREVLDRLGGLVAQRDSLRSYVLAGLIALIGISALLIWKKWGPR